MADNETIADIIAEKRRDAQHIRNNLSTVPVRRLDQLAEIKSLADEADRIEAAHRRELSKNASKNGADFGQLGDFAKMRKALVRFYEWAILDLNENAWMGDSSGNYKKLLDAMANEIAAALSAPPRNCDRFATVDEAREAHEAICNKYGKCHHGCPLNFEENYSAFDCFEAWLFSPATEKEGGL